jgi:hypothetical protein
MEIILEYIYTGSIKEESLTKDNIIEAFYAADYFQLLGLQKFIVKTIENTLIKDFTGNYSPELLSKVAEAIPLTEDNILLNLLAEAVAIIPLNTIEFGRLSITGLQYLLSCTHEKEKAFVTPEYEVFRYSAILAAKQVSNNTYKNLMKQLPTLEQLENSIQVKNKLSTNCQKVAKELEPLVEFIDFRRIDAQILSDIVEPLEIIPTEIISSVYQYRALPKNLDLNSTRGIGSYDWDESACGSGLIIEDNGKVVRASNICRSHQSARAKIILGKGIFEWDIIIERYCGAPWVGVCASENFNFQDFAGTQPTGWVLGDGYCNKYYNNKYFHCPPFKDGTRITVHLDMDKRSCAFTVDGIKYPEVAKWNNLPSKLYPVVSLVYPGRFRIQPHYGY